MQWWKKYSDPVFGRWQVLISFPFLIHSTQEQDWPLQTRQVFNQRWCTRNKGVTWTWKCVWTTFGLTEECGILFASFSLFQYVVSDLLCSWGLYLWHLLWWPHQHLSKTVLTQTEFYNLHEGKNFCRTIALDFISFSLVNLMNWYQSITS